MLHAFEFGNRSSLIYHASNCLFNCDSYWIAVIIVIHLHKEAKREYNENTRANDFSQYQMYIDCCEKTEVELAILH